MTARPFRRQLVVNSLASGLANVWAIAAGLISVPLLVAGLGRQEFGLWAIVMTFSATNGWASLADVGVVVATTRNVSAALAVDDRESAHRTVCAALATVVVLGLVSGGLLCVAALTFLPAVFGSTDSAPFRVALMLMALQVVLDLVINVTEGAIEGVQRVDLSRAVDSFRRFAVVAATSTAAVVAQDLRWVAVASLVATAVGLLVAVVTVRRVMPRFVVRPQRNEVRVLLRDGRGVALLRPLGVVQRTMDRIIVGVFLGPGAVALVELGTQLQAGAEAVLGASSYSIVPAASRLHALGDRSKLADLVVRGTRLSLLATAPVGVAVVTLSGPFIDLWVGERFRGAAGLAAVAALGVLLSAPLAVGTQLLLGIGRTTLILRGAGLAIVANLAASVVLLHFVGIVGVFWGTVIGVLVLLLVMTPSVLDVAGTTGAEFVSRAVLPVVPAGLVQAVVAVALLQIDLDPLPSLVVAGAGSAVAYAALAFPRIKQGLR